MGISLMGIFKSFQKNGHIANGHIPENYKNNEHIAMGTPMPNYAHLHLPSKNI